MAEFSVTEAAFTGFRVVRERPGAILIWAALQFVVAVAAGAAIILSGAGAVLAQLQTLGQAAHPDPAQVMALAQQLLPLDAAALGLALVFYPVVYAAMSRIVLRPEDSRFGYLRLGGDELRQLGLMLLYIALWLAAGLIVLIGAGLAVLVVGLTVKAAMPFVLAAGVAVVGAGAIFVAIRLSLAFPLTFATGRIDPFGSWRLTEGQFWRILKTRLLVLGLAILVGLLSMTLIFGLVAVTGGMEAVTSLDQPDMSSLLAYFTPVRLLYLALGAILNALIWPLFLTPMATIYRTLAGAPAPRPAEPKAPRVRRSARAAPPKFQFSAEPEPTPPSEPEPASDPTIDPPDEPSAEPLAEGSAEVERDPQAEAPPETGVPATTETHAEASPEVQPPPAPEAGPEPDPEADVHTRP